MTRTAVFVELRKKYHAKIFETIMGLRKGAGKGVYTIADKDDKTSVAVAKRLVEIIGLPTCANAKSGQTAGNEFAKITKEFLIEAFEVLEQLRPGDWIFSVEQGPGIFQFEQYKHLGKLKKLIEHDDELAATLGTDYLIKPDIVIAKEPVKDTEINKTRFIVNDNIATLTKFRFTNSQNKDPILHASISCKWTMRSDRAQNIRTEALNLIRNRKGKTPHIVAVTFEPRPSRLFSIAGGTGDVDCTYHAALPELRQALKDTGYKAQAREIETLVRGDRLRDIADLPFDLIT